MFRRSMCLAVGIAIMAMACVLPIDPAAAQAVADPSPTPIFDLAADGIEYALGAVVALLGSWVAWGANRFFGASTADKARQAVESALNVGVNIIMKELRSRGRVVITSITPDNQIVLMAVNYVRDAVPDKLKLLGIGDGEIARKLVARLPAPPEAPG